MRIPMEGTTTPEGGLYPVLPADAIIQVEVREVREGKGTNKQTGESWPKLEFEFQIVGVPTALEETHGSLVGSRIWGDTSMRFTAHPDNKLRQWVEALLGLDLADADGFELNTDDLVGKRARAVVRNYPKNNGGTGHGIQALLPGAGTSLPAGIDPWAKAAPVTAPASYAGAPAPAPADDVFAAIGSDDPPF